VVGLGLIFSISGILLSLCVLYGFFPNLTPLLVAKTRVPFRLLLLSIALFVIGFTLMMLGLDL